MCLSPILIKNVNYGNNSKLSYLSDSTSQFIPVPCGHCSVCLALKQTYLVQRVQMESLNHDLFFGTLTYNNECLPYIHVGDFKLAYVNIADWQRMIKMIRKHEKLPKFKYFLVTEYGGRRHRPHIHFILSFPKRESDSLADRRSFELRLYNIFLKYWRRNKGSTRVPLWFDLCTFKRSYHSYNYDLHYLDPYSSKKGLDDVGFYVTKYALKYDKWLDSLKSKLYYNLSEAEFTKVWNLLRPRRLISKGFGSPNDPSVISHINNGINLALGDPFAKFPYFINPVNGSTFPLSPYYSKKFLNFSDQEIFNSRKPTLTDYDMFVDSSPSLTPSEIDIKEHKFEIVRDFLSSRHTILDDLHSFVNNSPVIYGQNSSTIEMDSEFADCWQDFDFDNDSY